MKRVMVAVVVAAFCAAAAGGADNGAVTVDAQPGNPAVGFGSIWVPSSATGWLDRVDPKTLRIVKRIRSTKLHGAPQNQYFDSVALSRTSVWHASDFGNVVVRINPRTNKVAATVKLDGRPDEIAAGPASAYVGLFQTSTVLRITNRVVRKRDIGGLVMGMAYTHGRVWALSATGPTLLALDPVTLAVRKRVPVRSSAPFVGGFSSVWWASADASTICVGNLQQNAVTIVDAASGTVAKQVVLPSGRQPFSVAADGEGCWVTNDTAAFLVARDGSVASAQLPSLGASQFTGVAPGGWVTLAGRNKLVRVSLSH